MVEHLRDGGNMLQPAAWRGAMTESSPSSLPSASSRREAKASSSAMLVIRSVAAVGRRRRGGWRGSTPRLLCVRRGARRRGRRHRRRAAPIGRGRSGSKKLIPPLWPSSHARGPRRAGRREPGRPGRILQRAVRARISAPVADRLRTVTALARCQADQRSRRDTGWCGSRCAGRGRACQRRARSIIHARIVRLPRMNSVSPLGPLRSESIGGHDGRPSGVPHHAAPRGLG